VSSPLPPAVHRPDRTSAALPLRGENDNDPRARPRPPRAPADHPPQLRLAIARDGVGIELDEPYTLGCLDVTEIEVALRGMRFPLDVSGGVARFRHKRGALGSLAVELGARELERWAAPRLRGLIGPRMPTVWAVVRRGAATVGVIDGPSAREPGPDPRPPRVLAFDLTVGTEGDDVYFIVTGARGAALLEPPTTLAMRAVSALLGKTARRAGACFTVSGAGRTIARFVLPEGGARAPAAEGMRWTMLSAHADRWVAAAALDGAPAETTDEGVRAKETCALAERGDDARFLGDLEQARAFDVEALARAPRHPALARRIAEIDRLVPGRAEAALGTLVEAERDPSLHDGLLAGELYAETGDTAAAIASLVRAGETEPVPALVARAFERASELTADPLDALVWLDLAIARAPALPHLRWSRIARRIAAGRLEEALADAEHLEAQAEGGRARHAVWRRAGEAWLDAGLVTDAALLFERALRFDPNDPRAVAGLGTALVAAGRAARGAALLTHAIPIAEARGEETARMTVDLARALAERLDDRPAAVARVATVPNYAPEAPEARGLEGRWRAEIGDLAGASLAFARLRDLASTRVASSKSAEDKLVIAMLVEAAAFERDRKGDPLAAQRLLACALRLGPRDAEVQAAHRAAGQLVLTAQGHDPGEATVAPAAPPRDEGPSSPIAQTRPEPTETFPPSRPSFDFGLAAVDSVSAGEVEDAARVDELTRILQSDPTQDAVVDELAERLTRLGRTHELLALLSARLEEATPERRAHLIPQQRAVLERLEREARAAGRDLEASFFRDAVKMLEG
jgi:tetratricopeptide (TPR) repeat protein